LLVACAAAVSAVSEKAETTFPGKNGKIAIVDGVLYTINPNGSGKTKVTNTGASGYPIDYSPNGKKITYTSYEGDNDGNPTGPQKDAEIYTIDVGGGGKTNVTHNNRYDGSPSYSPNGKKIVYTGGDGRNPDIYTINVGGGGESLVTDYKRREYPTQASASWGSRP
jgi:Tol biopolymer transport system component